jgi:ABC-2 type transport system ATP-binding protein
VKAGVERPTASVEGRSTTAVHEARVPNGAALIELCALRKCFGERVALEALDLTVRRGEIFGLLGHNGAGKSTGIGMMLGQVWPTSGRARICGHDITRERAKALARVGAIFETPVFYDYLSGYRNLELLAHCSAATPRTRILEVLDWVGLSGREGSKVRTYSHGMRTRLALAQALLPNPELLILDEPSDGLDPEGIHEMRETILRLNRALGLTILFSSHLLNEVEQLCTRIAVLRQGRKVFEGTVSEATRNGNWLRLRVDDFTRAARLLHDKHLISDRRDGAFVRLRDGVESADVVAALVSAGVRVHEVAPEEHTLEHFYLSLRTAPRDALPRHGTTTR